MVKRIWLVSDTHFGHRLLADGVLRPWDNIEAMDDALVERWNQLVQPHDRVYHLGDVAINRRHLSTVGRLHGRKVLLKGNHDIFRLRDYLPYFEDIRAYKVLESRQAILSHIPLWADSIERFGLNIHGHLHSNLVRLADGTPDPRYANVCVEQHNYAPVALDEVLALCKT